MLRVPNKVEFGVLLLLLAGAAALAGCRSGGGAPSLVPSDLPVLGAVPDFSLTDCSSRTVSRSDLEGQVWVADFIFTNCFGPCPLLSRTMSKLQKALGDTPGVRLVSFSVDPERDTPEVLTAYAARYGADPERWYFLTGDKKALYRLIRDGFKLAIDDGPEAGADEPGPGLITHSVRFVLVDRLGQIRGYFDGTESDLVEKLLPRIQELLGEEPS